MATDDLREPALNDLCELSLLGNVIYAIRCARRIQPRFQLPETQPDADQMKAVVEISLRWAEEFVHKGTGALDRGVMLVEASSAVAEATYDRTDYAAYAAHHAVRAALLAAQNPGTVSQEVYMETVAAAFGSSRVLLANVPSWSRAVVVQALRGDFDKLLALHRQGPSQRGNNLDAADTGPLGALWPGSPPVW